MDRERHLLVQQTIRQLNQYYAKRLNAGGTCPPSACHRVKVTFKDEPGEGSGVARSFYVAIAEVSKTL